MSWYKKSVYIIAEIVDIFNRLLQGLTKKFQLLGLFLLSIVCAYKSGPDKYELSDPLALFALGNSLLCLFLLISYAEQHIYIGLDRIYLLHLFF